MAGKDIWWLACLPNNLLAWRWTSNGSFGDFIILSSVILQQWSLGTFLPLLSSSSPLCVGAKSNMGPLPGKFVTVPVALNFLGIALMVDMGIFRTSSYFFHSHSPDLWSSTHFSLIWFVCSLIFPMLMIWIREYGLCRHLHIYTPVKQEVMDYCLKVRKHSDQL